MNASTPTPPNAAGHPPLDVGAVLGWLDSIRAMHRSLAAPIDDENDPRGRFLKGRLSDGAFEKFSPAARGEIYFNLCEDFDLPPCPRTSPQWAETVSLGIDVYPLLYVDYDGADLGDGVRLFQRVLYEVGDPENGSEPTIDYCDLWIFADIKDKNLGPGDAISLANALLRAAGTVTGLEAA